MKKKWTTTGWGIQLKDGTWWNRGIGSELRTWPTRHDARWDKRVYGFPGTPRKVKVTWEIA